jgi:hypothetical protein
MLERKGRRLGCWFWIAVVAIVTNPLVWRLLFGLLEAGVQFVGSHLMFL